MKYLLITLSGACVILLICFIVCQQQLKTYEAIVNEDDSELMDVMPLDSIEKLALEVSQRNKLRHEHDLQQIDSLSLICLTNNHHQEDHPPSDIYVAEVATTILRDTVIYRKKIKDTIIYKPTYIYVNDTVHKIIEVVDTIYRRFRQRRNN